MRNPSTCLFFRDRCWGIDLPMPRLISADDAEEGNFAYSWAF